MQTWSFRVILEGVDTNDPSLSDALYEAGCDDALFGSIHGVHQAEFDREASSFAAAVTSAVKAIEAAVPGARVVRIERAEEDGGFDEQQRLALVEEIEARRADPEFQRRMTELLESDKEVFERLAET